MRILLITSAFNSLSQRTHRELISQGHTVSVELALNDRVMEDAVELFKPDLIICPFLKKKIPDHIWQQYICLIIHPGIEGDRGPSSLDWAISSNLSEWGTTVLQASEEMDAGDIWATGNFPMREASKASIFRREVISIATRLVNEAVAGFADKTTQPRPLDYSNPAVQGRCLPTMKQTDRRIDWANDNTSDVIRKIHAGDSQPGVRDEINGRAVYLYGASREPKLTGTPGEIIATHHGAICRATTDGAVWIKQAKLAPENEQTFIKLPAADALSDLLPPAEQLQTPSDTRACEEIYYTINCGVGYLYFHFSAGAMSTDQCERLRQSLIELKAQPNVKVIVLMGGEDFWSNGIQLNVIEASDNPAEEAWANIQAIDDFVLEVINSPKHITVAALRNNSGAGGTMMALACDRVVAREGVILNPHYKTMHLFGSEYWTYSLPKRVGLERALKLTHDCLPLMANEALAINMIDEVLAEDWEDYGQSLVQYCQALTNDEVWQPLINALNHQREKDEAQKPLQAYRDAELAKMKACFFDADSLFHQARRNFVYKVCACKTPNNIAIHRQPAAQPQGESSSAISLTDSNQVVDA